MLHEAEPCFGKGLKALETGNPAAALLCFRKAMEIELGVTRDRISAKCVSYYGLCLGLTGGRLDEAILRCREAVNTNGSQPEVYLNLGRVLLLAGRRRDAHQTLQWGLRLAPRHGEILRELRHMGVRKRPVLPFLSRRSPVNIFLGRHRH